MSQARPDNTSPRPYPPQNPLAKQWWKLVRFGFRLLYNEMAWTYDLVSNVVSFGQWREWQRAGLKHLHAPQGGLILEVAHGTGNLQIDLYKQGYKRIAFDNSAHMGRIAQRKLRSNNLPANLARAQAQTLPFPNEIFDGMISTFPTPFITQEETLQEAYRVLKPKARFIIVPNAEFTGGGAAKQALETAYQVTGQRGGGWSADILQRFAQVGFDLQFVNEACPKSVAQVLIATKT